MEITSPFAKKTSIATELLATKQTYDKYSGYWSQGSIYIENGELEKAEYVLIEELDMEGRYVISEIGIFKVKPEHFNFAKHETSDGTKHWYSYSLNQEGRDYLTEVEKVSYIDKVTLVLKSFVEQKIANLNVSKAATVTRIKRLEYLLKK